MATAVCLRIPDLPGKIEVNLPGIGTLSYLRDALDKMPRPSEYVLKLLNSIAPALGPFYTILKILDVILAIVNCTKAIPDSIMQFNPSPIIKCFEKLLKAFSALLALFPPFVYIRMIRDILVLIVALLDDILAVFYIIDAKISLCKAIFDKARADGDTVLLEIGECMKTDILKQTEGIQLVFEILGKLMALIFTMLELMADLVPGLPAKVREWKESMSFETPSITDFPPLGALATAIVAVRNVIGTMASFMSSVLGIQTTFSLASIPNFNNPG